MPNLNLNKVTLAGRLTADVELKQTPSGVPVCSFSIAINRRFATEQTDFIDCVAWKEKAEIISKYFRKGSSICIIGSLQKRNWTDQHNQKRYATEVVIEEVYFVDSKSDGDGNQQPTYSSSDAPDFANAGHDDDLPF